MYVQYTMRENESRNRNLIRLSENSLELVSDFQEQSRLKLKPSVHLQMYLFTGLQKDIYLVTQYL
jgi:hypothetical protein